MLSETIKSALLGLTYLHMLSETIKIYRIKCEHE